MRLAQLPDELTDLDHLCGVKADRGLVEDDQLRAAQQGLCNADPLPVALGQAADEPGHHVIQPGPMGRFPHLFLPVGPLHALELGREEQILLHRHLRVERRLLRQVAHARLGGIGFLRQRVPRHRDKAAGSGQVAGQNVHDSGLARTVRPQQTADLPILHGE